MIRGDQELGPGRLEVETAGGQLSKTTEWTLSNGTTAVCHIERVNWKWRWWTYRATIQLAGATLDVTSSMDSRALVLSVRDGNGIVIATARDRTAVMYRDRPFSLTGMESPDAVVDAAGTTLLHLHWRLDRLHHIDLMASLPAEFVAITTTFCLLHERPTN